MSKFVLSVLSLMAGWASLSIFFGSLWNGNSPLGVCLGLTACAVLGYFFTRFAAGRHPESWLRFACLFALPGFVFGSMMLMVEPDPSAIFILVWGSAVALFLAVPLTGANAGRRQSGNIKRVRVTGKPS